MLVVVGRFAIAVYTQCEQTLRVCANFMRVLKFFCAFFFLANLAHFEVESTLTKNVEFMWFLSFNLKEKWF